MAADHAMRAHGLPCRDEWDLLLGRRVVVNFHEDNETAIGAMRHGFSPAMRHLKRTHGVCLRWLAERFRDSGCNLFYERSALQAADIYTKAFSVPQEWDRALRLINVLNPARFWDGKYAHSRCHMGSQHKGGVEFGYRTPNPWHGRVSQTIPRADTTSTIAAPCVSHDLRIAQHVTAANHVPWLAPYSGGRGIPDGGLVTADCKDRDHCLADWFGESPDYDEADYASTVGPDSDDESLAEFPVNTPEPMADDQAVGFKSGLADNAGIAVVPACPARESRQVGGGIPTCPHHTADVDVDCIDRVCAKECILPSALAAALPAVVWA